MLKKLDRYIIGKFLNTFFFTVLIFSMISVIIDFSENVERFIESPISAQQVALGYYPNFVLFITGLLWPLFTLIAVIFFTSRMAYNSEIISIFNAGVSFRRFLRPYLLAAGLLTLMHLIGNHFIIPRGNKIRLDLEHTYIHTNQDKGKKTNVHLFIAEDTKVFVNEFRNNIAFKFQLEEFSGQELVKLIKASRAEWQEGNTWRLFNYQIRTFDGNQESLVIEDATHMDMEFNLHPEDFVDYKNQQMMMTTPQLIKYIRLLQSRGAGNTKKYQIERYRRTAEAFTIFILTIIGVAIASRKVRGGVGLHLAIGIGIGALFIFFSRFAMVFATGDSIPALLGIWLPNLLFGSIAAYLISKAQQ